MGTVTQEELQQTAQTLVKVRATLAKLDAQKDNKRVDPQRTAGQRAAVNEWRVKFDGWHDNLSEVDKERFVACVRTEQHKAARVAARQQALLQDQLDVGIVVNNDGHDLSI
ncbi:hypothetical protein [Acidithrix ferrooxidans]|uniref:Uncharacterized protein n=1 Tax=Acidithrix ferrooxidans TaxID=1280514 RepID=A0A0D8HKZ2_9ACTN|nr:hypothetical protein [Acidithrix ferrooxidans]KJF18519.1 hypothetical protein AXFE_05990 [Acidithrix ferrooxidans]